MQTMDKGRSESVSAPRGQAAGPQGLQALISDLELCDLAIEAYTKPPSIWNARVQARITHANGIAVIAFRGTTDLEGWAADLSFAPRSHPYLGICHAGFLEDALSVAIGIIDALDGAPAVLTGHSKGAAEALLSAGILMGCAKQVLKVTTFGCPAPLFWGNTKLRERLFINGVIGTDYWHGEDPVPGHPKGFTHPRQLQRIGSRLIAGLPRIEDHYIENYRAALAFGQAA